MIHFYEVEKLVEMVADHDKVHWIPCKFPARPAVLVAPEYPIVNLTKLPWVHGLRLNASMEWVEDGLGYATRFFWVEPGRLYCEVMSANGVASWYVAINGS